MKEFIEKLIGRLEEISVENTCSDCPYKAKCDEVQEHINDETTDLCGATIKALSIEIVNQLAEEYRQDLDKNSQGWIPCSERLPEEELEKAKEERGKNAVFPVLATINKVHTVSGEKYKIVNKAFYCYCNDKNFYNACCDKLDVIAWKPLDAPYQPNECASIECPYHSDGECPAWNGCGGYQPKGE